MNHLGLYYLLRVSAYKHVTNIIDAAETSIKSGLVSVAPEMTPAMRMIISIIYKILMMM